MIIQIENKTDIKYMTLAHLNVLKILVLMVNKKSVNEQTMVEYYSASDLKGIPTYLLFKDNSIPDGDIFESPDIISQEIKIFLTSLKIKGRQILSGSSYSYLCVCLHPLDNSKCFDKFNKDNYMSENSESVLLSGKDFFSNDFLRKIFQEYIFSVERCFELNFDKLNKIEMKELTGFISKRDKTFIERHKLTGLYFYYLIKFITNNGHLEFQEKLKYDSIVRFLTQK